MPVLQLSTMPRFLYVRIIIKRCRKPIKVFVKLSVESLTLEAQSPKNRERETELLKDITIYTDGACSGNPGPGGWGAILRYGNIQKELSGYSPLTTNNQMELLAAIEALKALKEPCKVALYTDSAYLCNAFNQRWIDKWQTNGWKTSNKQPVENQSIWHELLHFTQIHDVTFHKVKGHSDNTLNNRCDELARNAIKHQR